MSICDRRAPVCTARSAARSAPLSAPHSAARSAPRSAPGSGFGFGRLLSKHTEEMSVSVASTFMQGW